MVNEMGGMIYKKFASLKRDQVQHLDRWRELSDNMQPDRGRFGEVRKSPEPNRNHNIVNNAALLAARDLSAGLMAGVSSSSTPWVNFVIEDTKLMDSKEVRIWLGEVEKIIYSALTRSSAYDALSNIYTELGIFGTGALGVYSDKNNEIIVECYTIGSYYLSVNASNKIDTFYRELSLTADDMVMRFGKSILPHEVMACYKRQDSESEFKVIHAIEPNRKYKEGSKISKFKKFSSTYVYGGSSGVENYSDRDSNPHLILKSMGFDDFPIMTPRWDVRPGDAYGISCPGMNALGDTKSLQQAEAMKYLAMEKMIDPPTVSAAGLGNMVLGQLDAGVNVQVANLSDGGVKAIYDVRIDPRVLIDEIHNMSRRIKESFYVDLIKQQLNTDRREMTKAEVEVRKSESLVGLAPMLTRVHNELLDPLINRLFNMLSKAGKIPPPPEIIEGHELSLVYISTLAKAQKADDITTIEEVVNFVGQLANYDPNAVTKLDMDAIISEYAKSIGAPPNILRSKEEVLNIQAQRAEVARKQQEEQQAMQVVDSLPDVMKAAKGAQDMGIDLGLNQ